MNKADELRAQLVKLEAEAEALRLQIDEANVAEDKALREHIRTRPAVRALGVIDSPVSKLRRKREAAEKRLAGILEELPVLREETTRQAREEAERFVDGQRVKLRALEARSVETWRRLTEAFANLQHVYDEALADDVAEREELRAETVAVVDGWADLREKFTGEMDLVERAVSSSLAATIEKLRVQAGVSSHTGPQRIYADGTVEGSGPVANWQRHTV